jgi:hypothetical protein
MVSQKNEEKSGDFDPNYFYLDVKRIITLVSSKNANLNGQK